MIDSSRSVFWSVLTLRIVNSLCVSTYFNPDEYWQSLEVAHKIVFGYGHLTWEWKEGIRGYSHPLIFAAVYYILRITKLDYPMIVVLAPRVLQAIFAALADTFLYRIVERYNKSLAKKTVLCDVFCWFIFYCDVRTLSNTMEAQLSVIALYFWLAARDNFVKMKEQQATEDKKEDDKKKEIEDNKLCRILASAISALAFVMRPTAAIFFAPVVVLHLIWTFKSRTKVTFGYVLRVLVLQMLLPVVAVVGLATVIDTIFYGKFTFVPFNFLYHNVIHSVAEFYGTHSWHWYFTQGFPTMFGPFIILFLVGIFSSRTAIPRVLLFLCIWPVVIYSFLKHKEFRFIFTSLYLAMPFCAVGLEKLWFNIQNPTCFKKLLSFISRAFVLILFLFQLAMAHLFCFIYQRGPIAVMDTLTEMANMPRKELKKHGLIPIKSVAFLCECHSTPYYAYVHTRPGLQKPPFEMSFIDCTPNFNGNLTDNVEDRKFRKNPAKYIFDLYVNHVKGQKRQTAPSHIVTFSKYNKDFETFYSIHGYREIAVFPHDLETNVTLLARIDVLKPTNKNYKYMNIEEDDGEEIDPETYSLARDILRRVNKKH